MMLHIALRCLEGSTMSNLVHRRRRCARIVAYMVLLPGGQYARGWERSKYAGCPCRAPFVWDIYTQGVALLCPRLSACYPFRELTLQDYPAGQVFIYVYRLAIDARPERVMMQLPENIQACLRISRRAQHQWIARDIMHQSQGVFDVFVLSPTTVHDVTHSTLLPGRQYYE